VSLLTARGICVSYGALAVLQDASLPIAAGDRIAVVGPNGVGKSTLLRVLAGLVQPDAGTVSAAGTVGYLPQERDCRRGETAMEYIARRTGVAAAEAAMLAASDRLAQASVSEGQASRDYAAALETYLALGGPDLEARATELAAGLGLPADLDRQAVGYSGGQAARLALAAGVLGRYHALLRCAATQQPELARVLGAGNSHTRRSRGARVAASH